MATETYQENPLVIGGFPTFTLPKIIASGQGVLTAGTVLGKITATGKCVKSLTASADGSEVARYILAADVDATAADVTAPVYVAGVFSPSAMVFGTGHTAQTVADHFDGSPMFIRQPVAM